MQQLLLHCSSWCAGHACSCREQPQDACPCRSLVKHLAAHVTPAFVACRCPMLSHAKTKERGQGLVLHAGTSAAAARCKQCSTLRSGPTWRRPLPRLRGPVCST